MLISRRKLLIGTAVLAAMAELDAAMHPAEAAIFTDNFVGTAGTLISSRTGWSIAGSTGADNAKLDGAGFMETTDTAGDTKLVYHDHGGADHYSQAVLGANFNVTSNDTTGGIFLVLVRQVTSRGTGYGVAWDVTVPGWRVRRMDTLASLTSSTDAGATAGDTIRLTASGASLVLTRNGATIISTGDGVFTTQTAVGLQPRSSAVSTITGLITNWQSALTSDPPPGGSAPAPRLPLLGVGSVGAALELGPVAGDFLRNGYRISRARWARLMRHCHHRLHEGPLGR